MDRTAHPTPPIDPPASSALSEAAAQIDAPRRGYALVAAWNAYVWLSALLAARPGDLRVAMAMAELEDQLLPLARDLADGRIGFDQTEGPLA